MKKTFFILLVIIAVNLNLFSTERSSNTLKRSAKAQFSSIDWAEVTAASLGCVFFTTAALMAYHTIKIELLEDYGWMNMPSDFVGSLYIRAFTLLKHDNLEALENKSLILGGCTSGIVAAGLGTYVYKKLTQVNIKKNISSSTN